jgi:hypothetical protein
LADMCRKASVSIGLHVDRVPMAYLLDISGFGMWSSQQGLAGCHQEQSKRLIDKG